MSAEKDPDMMLPKAYVVIQARMGSSRFPGKSLAEIAGKPILWYLFRQLAFCRTIDDVVLATTASPIDDPLAAYGENQNWRVFRGSEDDVLDRYYRAMMSLGASPDAAVVRLTGDDILTDPNIVDAAVSMYRSLEGYVSFVTTDRSDRLPYGAQVELCSFAALSRAHAEGQSAEEREHVFPYIRNNPDMFPASELIVPAALPQASLSIDDPADLARNEMLINEMLLTTEAPFHLHDILNAAQALNARGVDLGMN